MIIKSVIFDLDNTLLNTNRLEDARRKGRRDEVKNKLDEMELFPKVADLLNHIHSLGLPMALVTNSPRWYADMVLDKFELNKIFPVVITYNDVAPDVKPSPRGIEIALRNLGVVAGPDVLYVGDSDDDVEAAYRANIIPLAPSWATVNQKLSKMPAAVVSSSQLKGIIAGTRHYRLFAEEVAQKGKISDTISEFYYAPLDYNGYIVAPNLKDIEVITLGRYFPTTNALTNKIGSNHHLTQEIERKRESDYVIPHYISKLFAVIIEKSEKYFPPFNVVTVIPSKPGKIPRLENMLADISKVFEGKGIRFIPDLFVFSAESKSLKQCGDKAAREAELRLNYTFNERYSQIITGANVLILDDVITTGATISTSKRYLVERGVKHVLALCLAKNVYLEKVEDRKICPREHCGGYLAPRRSQYGEFYGCTNYHTKGCTHKEPYA